MKIDPEMNGLDKRLELILEEREMLREQEMLESMFEYTPKERVEIMLEMMSYKQDYGAIRKLIEMKAKRKYKR